MRMAPPLHRTALILFITDVEIPLNDGVSKYNLKDISLKI